jgi:hypothetical protein
MRLATVRTASSFPSSVQIRGLKKWEKSIDSFGRAQVKQASRGKMYLQLSESQGCSQNHFSNLRTTTFDRGQLHEKEIHFKISIL